MNVFISEQAETDLLQIYRYLAARNPAAAESMVQQIDRRFVNLSQFPFIGRVDLVWPKACEVSSRIST